MRTREPDPPRCESYGCTNPAAPNLFWSDGNGCLRRTCDACRTARINMGMTGDMESRSEEQARRHRDARSWTSR